MKKQANKTGKLMYISSQSESEQENKKTGKQEIENMTIKLTDQNQSKPKYGHHKYQSYQIKKNTITTTGFQDQYVLPPELKCQVTSIHYVGENLFNIQGHTTPNAEDNNQTEENSCDFSILKKLEDLKYPAGPNDSPKQPKTARTITRKFFLEKATLQQAKAQQQQENPKNPQIEQQIRTARSKQNIIAKFDFNSQDSENQNQNQNRFQIQNTEQNQEEQSEVKNQQSETVLRQSRWESSTPRDQFALQRVKEKERMFLLLQRQSSGLNYFTPQFDLYFGNDIRLVLSCKKKLSANFECVISLDKNDHDQKSASCVGKLVGNFKNNTFNLIDTRKKGITCTIRMKKQQDETIPSPESIQIYLLNDTCQYSDLVGGECTYNLGLDQLHKIPVNRQYISYFRNKKPEFCKQLGAFLLNFGGRVKKGSVKNFIIEDGINGKEILMFGKANNQNFNMYLSYPFTPLIGLGVVMTQFISKVFK